MIKTSCVLLVLFLLSPILFAQQTQPGIDPSWIYVSTDYELIPNIVYATANGQDLKLDVYRTSVATGKAPTIIFYHGGGWVAGNKEEYGLFILPYLGMGFSVVNVEYRLGSVALAPAAVEDCRCALRWVRQNAANYNFDPDKIIVTGTSAGGHLALMAGMLSASSIYDHQCATEGEARWSNGTEPELKVAGIINWFGITDVADLLTGSNAKHYAMEWLGSIRDREQLATQLSPLTYVRAGIPPVLTIHGDQDSYVPYSHAVRLHELLNKAGVENRLITVKGGKHGDFTHAQMLEIYDGIHQFLLKHQIAK